MAKESTGYIGKDKKGSWFARVTYTAEDGRRRNVIRKASYKAEAKLTLKALVRDLEENGRQMPEAGKMTFADLADFYEKKYVVAPLYVNDRKVEGLRDTKHVKAFLRLYKAFFGSKKLNCITYSDLCSFKTHRLKVPTQRNAKRSLTTVNRELAALRRIFNIAVQEGWLVKNPFKSGESLIEVSAERKRERILTLEEEVRLLGACDTKMRRHLKPFLIALLSTGCRKSELTLLTWQDVDFDSRIITIRALNTKSLRSRKLAITQRLYDELRVLWKASNNDSNSRVFGIKDNVRKAFTSACKAARLKEGGIDGLTLHSLRHSVAVRLVKGNLPIQMVGRILGHTQPQTTYRYLSANDETLYEAASILDSLQKE